MAKIDWYSKLIDIFTLLKQYTVRETAEKVGVSYGSLCKFIKSHQINKTGILEKKVNMDDDFHNLMDTMYSWSNNPKQVAEVLGISTRRLLTYAKQYNLKFAWDLTKSEALQVRIGRKAEVFVASLPDFKVLKDTAKYHTNAPHDLILANYGGVDVKSTKLRKTDFGGFRWKFNVASNLKKTSRQVKYYFLVGYDEEYEKVLALFILPNTVVKGKSSISISYDKLEDSVYNQFLYKRF